MQSASTYENIRDTCQAKVKKCPPVFCGKKKLKILFSLTCANYALVPMILICILTFRCDKNVTKMTQYDKK